MITRDLELDLRRIISLSKPFPSPSLYHDACSLPVTTPPVSSCWSIFMESCPGWLPAQLRRQQPGGREQWYTDNNKQPGYGLGKREGKKWSWYSASNRFPNKSSLQRHHQYFLGRQRHEMKHLEEVICHPVMTSNVNNAVFPVNLLSFVLGCIVKKNLTEPLTHVWNRGLSTD